MGRLRLRLLLLACISIVLLIAQFYYVRYTSTRSQSLTNKSPRNVYVFTRIHRAPIYSSAFGHHCKMLRRQYKRVAEKQMMGLPMGESYKEYFLDANSIRPGDEWEETTFNDTFYVDSPLLTMLEFIAGNMPMVSSDSIFVYMNDCLFDLTNLSALQTIDQSQRGLFCLSGLVTKNVTSCEHDYFAFNYDTAKRMRWKLLMTRNLNSTIENQLNIHSPYLVELRKSLETRVGLDTKTIPSSSAISDFFTFFEHFKIDKKYTTSNSSAINVNLVRYTSPDDFAARVNEATVDGLQPVFQPNSPQPLVKYLVRPASCHTGPLTVFIKCARSDVFERDWIRNYTSRMAAIGNFTFDRVFLLGDGDKDEYSEILINEAKTHGDILIGDFTDTYDNLPIKTYLGYQYFVKECHNKMYVVFQDSDAFTMIDLLMEDFAMDEAKATDGLPFTFSLFSKNSSAVYCIKGSRLPTKIASMNYFPKMGHLYTSKWYMWLDQIDPKYKLPEYCNGNCNALTAKAAHRIWNEARRTDRMGLRIEDLYFLGYMRQKAERKFDQIPIYDTQQVTQNYLSVHSVLRSHVKRNGLNRCLHLGDAKIWMDDRKTQFVEKKDMYSRVAEWYLDGDFTVPMENFVYGPSEITNTGIKYGYFMNLA